MTPAFPLANHLRMSGCNSVPLGGLNMCFRRGADLAHLICRKSRAAAFFAGLQNATPVTPMVGASREVAEATLLNRIPHILALSAKEQMIGIDARRHVALVADVQSFRNRAAKHEPRSSMGRDTLPVECCRAVATCAQAARPYPAPIGVGRETAFNPSAEIVEGSLWAYAFHSHWIAPVKRLVVRAGVAVMTRFQPAKYSIFGGSALAIAGAE